MKQKLSPQHDVVTWFSRKRSLFQSLSSLWVPKISCCASSVGSKRKRKADRENTTRRILISPQAERFQGCFLNLNPLYWKKQSYEDFQTQPAAARPRDAIDFAFARGDRGRERAVNASAVFTRLKLKKIWKSSELATSGVILSFRGFSFTLVLTLHSDLANSFSSFLRYPHRRGYLHWSHTHTSNTTIMISTIFISVSSRFPSVRLMCASYQRPPSHTHTNTHYSLPLFSSCTCSIEIISLQSHVWSIRDSSPMDSKPQFPNWLDCGKEKRRFEKITGYRWSSR